MKHRQTNHIDQLKRENELLKNRVQQLEEALMKINDNIGMPITQHLNDFADVPLPYLTLDESGHIQTVNPLWTEMMGYSMAEVNGTSISHYLSAQSQISFKQQLADIIKNGWSRNAEFEFISKDGGLVYVSVNTQIQRDAHGNFKAAHCILNNISLQKLASEQLMLAETEWQVTFDAISDPICLLNQQCLILKCNAAFANLLNMSKEQIIDQPCYQLVHHLNNFQVENCPFNRSQKSGKRETAVQEIFNGFYQVIIDPIIGHDGNVNGAVHIFKDITQQKRAEKALQQNTLRMKSLLKVMQHESQSIQEFTNYALEEAIKLTDSKIGFLFFYNEVNHQFTLYSWSKNVMNECAIKLPQESYDLDKAGLWAEPVRQRKPIIINNYDETYPQKKGYPQGHAHISSFLGIPVFKGKHIVAVIGVANKTEEYNNTDILHLNLLMDSARKVIDRMRSEDALRISEENFRSTMDNSPLGIRIVDINSKTVYANEVLLNIFGFSSIDEFNAPHPSEMYTPDSYAEHLDRHEKRKRGERTPKNYEIDIIRKDGSIRHLQVIRKGVVWNGEMLYQVVYQDITKRKQAEEQVLKLSRVTEQSPESIIITDTSGKIE